MSNSGRANMSVMGRDVAAAFTGEADIYPRRNDYQAVAPVVEERQTLATSSTSNVLGSMSYFEFGRPFDLSREWYIAYDRAAGTSSYLQTVGQTVNTYIDANGQVWPATPGYFEDYEIYSTIDYARIVYNNKPVWEKKGEQMLEDVQTGAYCTKEERSALAALQNGQLTVGERQVRFQQAQTQMTAPLQMPWRFLHKTLVHTALPNKIRLEIYWKTANQCIHQAGNGVTPGAITNLNLVIDATHLLEARRKQLYNDIYNGSMPYQIKTTDWEYEWRYGWTATTGVANTDASQTLLIRNLRNNTYAISAKLQYQDMVDVPACLDRQKALPIRSIVLDDQGKNVTISFVTKGQQPYSASQSLLLHADNVKAFPNAAPGSLLYYIKFCPNEYVLASEHNCYGARTIAKYSNPDCKITYNLSYNTVNPYPDLAVAQYPPTTPSYTKMYLTLTSYIHQLIYQGKSDFRRYLLS